MQIAAYILSCPDRENLRAQTLANLAATDWCEPAHVVVDQTTYERRQQRQTETALRLLQNAVADGAEFFLFLEDDLDFNQHLRYNLEHWHPMRHVAPDGHLLASLYNPGVRALDRDQELSFFVADPNCVYGSQAFVMSAATGRYIVEHWESHIGMQDIKMSRLAAQVTPIYYHSPSLVQHIGVESAWGGPYHRTLDFQQDWKTTPFDCRVSSAMTLARMRMVEGWLDDVEAKLLIAKVVEAVALDPNCSIVEVGSYCGKSTVVFGLTLRQLGIAKGRVYSIDPHDGVISAIGGSNANTAPTFEKFTANMEMAGLSSLVEPIVARSSETEWNREIDLLFVDGLHDYDHVSQDFKQFAHWVRPGGFVAFHDCAPYFPGVPKFVQEVLRSGGYKKVADAKSLAVLQKI